VLLHFFYFDSEKIWGIGSYLMKL